MKTKLILLALTVVNFATAQQKEINHDFISRKQIYTLEKKTTLDLNVFYIKSHLTSFGQKYTRSELSGLGEKLNETPSFSIQKSEMISYINSIKTDKDSRIVFSFGKENGSLSLFLDIKKLTDGSSIQEVKEIMSGTQKLETPINEIVKKNNYVNSLSNFNKKHRKGITHVINSQEINNVSELGFIDFLNQFSSENILYIYEGVGKVPNKKGDYKKLYFSFSNQLSFTSEILYNRNGTCCPPAD